MISLLQQWITYQAEARPDATAVVDGTQRLTYIRVEEESNKLARMLRRAGCMRGDRVCMLMPKSATSVISILAILKADCSYTPIDPASPGPRVRRILESLDARILLGAGQVGGLLEEVASGGRLPPVGWLDDRPLRSSRFTSAFTRGDVLETPATPLTHENTPDDTAYILYTSGSTGTPKGVVITHANVIPFVEWAVKYFDVRAGDRHSGHIPLHFDLSVFDLFGTFARGASLYLVPPELNLFPHRLAEFIRSSELTQWFSVPSILNYMAKFDALRHNDFPAMKRLLWCGEVFPTPPLMYWMRRLPHVKFTNLYGPTETTIASSYYTVPECPLDERDQIPIGRACDGEELLVLDENLNNVRRGDVGDLYIGGVGLSPGYWRDPEKTKEVFLRRPGPAKGTDRSGDRIYKTGDLARISEDGLVYFLGRADSQIKSRGYRIELGEIESALNTLDAIQESAVVAVSTEGFEGSVICCAYVPRPDRSVTPLSMRKDLAGLLPPYMLPVQWKAFDRLPKNANGKIDRKVVKGHFESSVHTAENAGKTPQYSDGERHVSQAS